MRNRTLSIKDLQKEPIKHYNHSVSEKPLVSVCVQTYQHAPYIRECLNSILMQKTDFDFEILLGEDESADGTREICIEYAEKYPDKIRLFLHKRENVIKISGSPTGRFNFLYNLNEAKGKYIALLEGDDYWTVNDKLQYQVDFLESNNQCFMINHRMPSIGKSEEGWYNMKQLFIRGYLPHTSNYMFRRFSIDKYKIPLLNMLGGEMCVLYISATEGLIFHDSHPVSFYRSNSKGIYTSKDELQRLEGALQQIRLIKKFFNVNWYIYHTRRFNFVKKINMHNNKYRPEIFFYSIFFKVIGKIKVSINNLKN